MILILHFSLQVFSLVAALIVFPFSAHIIKVERYYVLPSSPTRGHSLTLLLFWTFLFASENISLMNLERDDWWFHLNT